MIGIKLSKHKKETMNKIEEFLNPKEVYFKIKENDEVLVKENEKVIVGQKIIKTKYDTYIHSSVSGIVKEITTMIDYQNNKSNFIKIENDFNETNKFKENDLKNITKEQFISNLKENGIVGLGGAGFPTYVKYNNDDVKTLIINAVECEPYITADYINCFNNIDKIVETLNIIDNIYNLNEIFIAIKTKNRTLKEKIIPYIIKNKKIKLIEVPNLYPMGWEKALVRYIKHTDYDKLPIEKSIIVSNASTIYSIYESLKYNKPLIEKIVTISGDNIINKTNVKVKIGTKFSELKKIYKGYNSKEINLVTGGPMMGYSVETDEFIIPNNLNSVIGIKKIKEFNPITCLRCGKCSDHCPTKICPVLVKDNINNNQELKRLNVERCIECGICSFVCPSKINLREYVREAKKKVK
ncbi:MAG: RnfABCDGE type electron transport complex subunit C [Bacilli bacterium]|nr:RnfABCDGE type electron transport complex subunit C [Bacilli bacterium]